MVLGSMNVHLRPRYSSWPITAEVLRRSTRRSRVPGPMRPTWSSVAGPREACALITRAGMAVQLDGGTAQSGYLWVPVNGETKAALSK